MKSSDIKNLSLALFESTDGKTGEEQKKALQDFASYLSKKRLIGKADEIIEAYQKLYNKKHNIVEATVTLNQRLSEKTRLELREALKKKHKATEVHMLEKVDQRLIGGLKIRVGDEVFDGSIQNALKQLQAQLLK